MFDFLGHIFTSGVSLFSISVREAIRFICFTGKGSNTFNSCYLYFQFQENLECIQLTNCQTIDEYDSDCISSYSAVDTHIIHSNTIRTQGVSCNSCRFILKSLLEFLYPFLCNRKTGFRTFIFDFSYNQSTSNSVGYTTFNPSNDLIVITFNMKLITSPDFFLNVAIHELSHVLVEMSDVNEGHNNDFYYMYASLLHVISSESQFSTNSLFPPSRCLSFV